MRNRFNNWWSYTVFHLSSHKGLFLAILVDIVVLIYTVVDDYYKSISTPKVILTMVIITKLFLIWQIYGFFKQRLDIYKNVDPGGEGKYYFPESSDKYRVADELIENYSYSIDKDCPILRNHNVDEFLLNESKTISISVQREDGRKITNIKKYFSHYESTLLYFLNKKWKHSNYMDGEFVNEKKICFTSEPSFENNSCKFYICPGQYYYGYMTNAIYCKSITSNNFETKAPWNCENHKIDMYENSSFSDHIGVSTLAVFVENNQRKVLVFQQSSSAGKSARQLCPTGSGSMDWADLKSTGNDDFKKTIITAVERELREECKISKRKWEEIKKKEKTKIIAYYRDMRFGGKPEFCCVTEIGGLFKDFKDLLDPNEKELSNTIEEVLLNEEGWTKLLQKKDENEEHMEPSLALKVNFKLAMDYYKELDKKREANPLIS